MHSITSCVCIDVDSKSQIKAVEEMIDGGSNNINMHAIYKDAMFNWGGKILQTYTD